MESVDIIIMSVKFYCLMKAKYIHKEKEATINITRTPKEYISNVPYLSINDSSGLGGIISLGYGP